MIIKKSKIIYLGWIWYLINGVSCIYTMSLDTKSFPLIDYYQYQIMDVVETNEQILQLQCQSKSKHTQIKFYFKDQLIQNNTRLGYFSNDIISIRNISYTKDDGVYKCIACNENGCAMKKLDIEIPVIGHFLPGFQYDDKINYVDVVINRTAELFCPDHTLSRPLRILWGKKIPIKFLKETDIINFVDGGKKIFISKVTEDILKLINQEYDGIRCAMLTKNRLTYSSKIKLNVVKLASSSEFKPIFYRKLPKQSYVTEGSEKILQCLHSGNPQPEIKWYFNKERVFTNNTLFHMAPNNPSKLTIKRFNKQYEGQYDCIIDNKLGKEASYGNLSLAVAPSFYKEMNSQSIKKNKTLSLECHVVGTQPITFQWLYNGVNIININNRSRVKGNTLEVHPTESNDTGTYYCLATNKYGEIYKQINIIVVDSDEELIKINGREPGSIASSSSLQFYLYTLSVSVYLTYRLIF